MFKNNYFRFKILVIKFYYVLKLFGYLLRLGLLGFMFSFWLSSLGKEFVFLIGRGICLCY